MAIWISAGLWGLLGAASLVVGATVSFFVSMPRTVTAGIMSFGCGVLISAVAYDLLEDGFQEGGIWPIVGGAVIGSAAYAVADWLVSRQGAQNRKHSGNEQANATEGGGLAIAIGSLLDGIPECVVLGLGLLSGKGVSIPMLAAIFLSNLPEGLSSVSGAARPIRLFVRRPVSAVRRVIFCKGAHNGRPFGRHKTTVVTAHRSVCRRRPESSGRMI